MQKQKTLIVLRGVPGSGKSTLAGFIQIGLRNNSKSCTHYEADMFFQQGGKYEWDANKLGEAHRWCQMKVNDDMRTGYDNIIVSNTFVRKEEMQIYLEMAKEHGYQIQEIICRGEFENIHGVPQDKVEKKKKQFEF